MPQETVFLTGATGFVGRHLLERLGASPGRKLVCLARRPPESGPQPKSGTVIEWVQGDLTVPGPWTEALRGASSAVHLAALTGKAPAAEHERVNVEGTRDFVQACRAAGVRRLLFVSTIATSYPEKRRYPYARSKERAEGLVRAYSGDWTVFRPTIVLGTGAPIWDALCRLARMPLTPVFGGGKATVQPIAVEDVVDAILSWLREGGLARQTIDLGGPEILSFRDLLRRVKRALGRGGERGDGGLVPVPWGPTVALLGMLEPFLLRQLPLTAGQLYAFRYDGTAAPSDFGVRRRERLVRLDALIERLARETLEREAGPGPGPTEDGGAE